MGTDITWILERRAGRDWQAVTSSERFWQARLAAGASDRDPDRIPAWRLGERNYPLFALLSGVRTDHAVPLDPLMTPGLPDDASPYAIDLIEAHCHSPGSADGRTIATWRGAHGSALHRWLDALDAVLDAAADDAPDASWRNDPAAWRVIVAYRE